MPAQRTRIIVGCMTGTSMDGLDAAMVHVRGSGLGIRATVLRTASRPLGALAGRLRPVAQREPFAAEHFTRLAHQLAQAHVAALRPMIRGARVDFVVVHGQTVFHQPPLSWQLLNPWPIAAALGVPVLYDLRGADLAMGGEGAPITPLADHLLLQHPRETRVVINLGGFINYTRVPASRRGSAKAPTLIRAGDVCACNQLLDAVARQALGRKFDAGGRAALRGAVDRGALRALVCILGGQAGAGRSLGTGDEAFDWTRRFHRLPGSDLARTACAAIARVVTRRVGRADRYIIAGGGANNAALVAELRDQLGTVDLLDHHGIPGQYREAVEMAVLGALCDDGAPITLPQVTGCRRPPVSGAWAGRDF